MAHEEGGTMSAPQFKRLSSRAVALLVDDVDTDQIIPARYLTVTDKDGLGEGLFSGWRYDADGNPDPEFPLNQPGAESAKILIAGRNFGCGSSREHAAWALLAEGYRAVVAPSFADIFRGNALKNGLLVVELDSQLHADLVEQVQADPEAELTIDLPEQVIRMPNGEQARFPIDGFSKQCLLEGVDSLGYLLKMEPQIRRYEADHE
jgi:3-isopropylmalate/(R)-2-methylmalate dehydratase small subunit